MHALGGELRSAGVSGGATQNTSVLRDRLGAQAGAEDVADHAAEAGVRCRRTARCAEGWLCVSTLKQTASVVVERDDAGVVGEDADRQKSVASVLSISSCVLRRSSP